MSTERPSYRARRFTTQNGVGTAFRDYGDPNADATPVLCLAGLTRNADDFAAFAERHAGRRRVLCLDLRGRGASDKDPDWRNYSPQTYLNDIGHLLSLTNVHRVVVVGTSLGGLLAMGLGASLPSALAGVVLNDIGPDLNPTGLKHIIEYISVDRPQPDWASAKAALQGLLPDLVFQTEDIMDGMVRNTFRKGEDGLLHFNWDIDIVRPLLDGKADLPDIWPLFRGLRDVPTLALRGERSGLLSEATFERMSREHPKMRAVTVARTGHAPTLAEPECVAALDDFLDGL